MWTTFPAGGGGRVRGAFLKTMGLQAGWPDLLVFHPHPNTGLIVVGIELKAGKNDQTAEQRYVQECFFQCGAWYVLCRSIDEVERCLRFCKVPLHASVSGQKVAA
jgi:hypothetical protein